MKAEGNRDQAKMHKVKRKDIVSFKRNYREDMDMMRKYLITVKNQMQQTNVEENKATENVKKLLPIKLHLQEWQARLNLKDKKLDNFQKKVQEEKEANFNNLLNQIQTLEWTKLKVSNRQELEYLQKTISEKFDRAYNVIDRL